MGQGSRRSWLCQLCHTQRLTNRHVVLCVQSTRVYVACITKHARAIVLHHAPPPSLPPSRMYQKKTLARLEALGMQAPGRSTLAVTNLYRHSNQYTDYSPAQGRQSVKCMGQRTGFEATFQRRRDVHEHDHAIDVELGI